MKRRNYCPNGHFFGSISHSRGVHLFLFLLLELADTVDGGERIVGVGHPDAHGVVLMGYLRCNPCNLRLKVFLQVSFALSF